MIFLNKAYLANRVFYVDMDGTLCEWNGNADYRVPYYFLNLAPQENVVKSIKELVSIGADVRIATAVIGDEAIADKREWLARYGLDNIPFIAIPYGEDKDKYLIGSERVLIDDHTPNLLKFGGKGIKVLNGINHKKGVWRGPVIHKDMDYRKLAAKILCIAGCMDAV